MFLQSFSDWFQGSSTQVLQPCYDGRALPIAHQVASDGLALLSIKDSHNDCTVVHDSHTKISSLSCTHGIKPRNSFWNIHKPELRKVKGLECTTTANVIELFESHNTDNAVPKSCTRKLISKLGSVYKKTRPASQPQVLTQNVSWPINCCILSSISQEKEIVSPEAAWKEEIEKVTSKYDFEGCTSNFMSFEEAKDTIFITHPQTNMRDNTSDDLIPVNEHLNPPNGDSFTNTRPFNMGNPRVSVGSDGATTSDSPMMTSSILLENKPSQHQISIPSNVKFYKENAHRENYALASKNMNTIVTGKKNQNTNDSANEAVNYNDLPMDENPSSIAVQSIFSDIFQDIEEIKDVINTYMSSFCVQEEEHNNFPNLFTSSREVTSHFYEQVHGPPKDKNSNKIKHNTFCHGLQESEENNCTLEQRHTEVAEVTKSDEDIQVQESYIIPEKNTENISKNEGKNQNSSGYCYWEDNDLEAEFTSGQAAGKLENSGTLENKNTSLVTLEFIENMWEEFTTQVKTHALLVDLITENEQRKIDDERQFPSYGHWSNMYDPNIFQEAENIVHTLDSLLMNGCFPTEEAINNPTYLPCTIVELIDESEFAEVFEVDSHDKPNDEEENLIIERNSSTSHENETECNLNMRNEYFTLNDLTTEIGNIDQISLEPVSREKFEIQHVEYYRVPQYEIIQLDPITHLEKINTAKLQTSISSTDLSQVEIKQYAEEKVIEHINITDNLLQKYAFGEAIKNEEYIFENMPKSQPSVMKHDTGLIITEESRAETDKETSKLENTQEISSTASPNPAFLFSSPTMQINMTNLFHKK